MLSNKDEKIHKCLAKNVTIKIEKYRLYRIINEAFLKQDI